MPLPGVKIAAGDKMAVTDEKGNFVLRDLPAGPVTLRLVPLAEPPAEVKLPTWNLNLPQTPFDAEGIKINLTNGQLLTYLQPQVARSLASRNASGGNAH